MVSGYADAFADELIRLAKEVGVRYFKWDGISQYGCDDPHHDHGSENNSERERADSYAFELARIADKVAAAVPGTIVAFDVTEAGRSFAVAFLASGKYFLINNCPYYENYDVPIDLEHANWNLFFYQGQARTWIARSPLTFDKWIPSTLFLTHYFPDDPQQDRSTYRGAILIWSWPPGTWHMDEKSPTRQLELGLAASRRMAIKATRSRFYGQVDWICKHSPTYRSRPFCVCLRRCRPLSL